MTILYIYYGTLVIVAVPPYRRLVGCQLTECACMCTCRVGTNPRFWFHLGPR